MMKFEDIVQEAGSIAILGHVHPDGDCVGSTLGTFHYLKNICPGAEIKVYLESLPESFKILQGSELISTDFHEDKTYELVICLDASDRERLGDAVTYLDRAKRTVCIDHHITNTGYAEVNIVRSGVSSASEIAASLMDESKIDLAAAECLYLGIVHDTGVFKHSNTSQATMEMAGMLLAKGVSSSKIIDDTFYKKTFAANQLLGRALLGASLHLDGKLIASVLSRKEMEALSASAKDTDGIIDQLRVTDGVEMALLLYEGEEGRFKISMRSNRIVDVAEIAGHFGGGGHVRAAGASSERSAEELLSEICGLALKQLEMER